MTDWLGMGVTPRAPRPEARAQVLARAFGTSTGYSWRSPFPLAIAAAALLVVAVSISTAALRVRRLNGEIAQLRDSVSLVAWEFSGAQAVAIPVTTSGRRGAITVLADSASRTWVITCLHLTPNAPSETYQLWFVTDTGLQNAALMPMDGPEPMAMTVSVPPGVRGLAMSIEPRGGSVLPRGRLIFEHEL
jgi:hypothetical protein